MPGPMSTKNALSAVSDLGLGDMLVQQLQDQEDARKKQPGGVANSPQGFGMMGSNTLMAARSLGLS